MIAARALIVLVVAWPVAGPSQPRSSAGQPPAPGSCRPVVVGNPDGNYVVPGVEGAITYRVVDDTALQLDAFVPRDARSRSAVVVVHGGSYTAGSRVAHIGQLLELIADAGLPWFSVDYRLGGQARRAEAIDDVEAAVAFVRCQASRFGIDGDRIVLVGEDTGADIALALLQRRVPGVTGAALVGGRFDAATLARPAVGAAVLLVHGSDDDEQPIAGIRARCGRDVGGGPCELIAVPGGIHRSENWRPSQWGYKPLLVGWIDGLGAAPRAEAELARLRPSLRPWPAAVPGPPGSAVNGLADAPLPPGLHKRLTWDADRGLTLDAWVPASQGPHPLAIVVHGGGWEAGDRVTYITPILEPLAKADIAWVSIDYRLTPDVRHPEQLDDLRRAVRFLRDHAATLGADPSRVVLVGESASGQMATLVAANEPGLAGVVSLYGVYDFAPMVTDAGPRSLLARLFDRHVLDDESRRLLRDASPLHAARSGMPPMLLVHGTAESLWAQAVAYDARLTALGVTHAVVRLDGAPHGMENWEGHSHWRPYKERVVRFIRDAGVRR